MDTECCGRLLRDAGWWGDPLISRESGTLVSRAFREGILHLESRRALELTKLFRPECFIFHFMLSNNVIKKQNCV